MNFVVTPQTQNLVYDFVYSHCIFLETQVYYDNKWASRFTEKSVLTMVHSQVGFFQQIHGPAALTSDFAAHITRVLQC